jgi:Polyketide cyclase / dehydrase and lipid transport
MNIGIGLLVLLAVLLLFIASRPAKFRIERSAQMSASSAAVFALLNDFHQWGKWSPWEKLDPAMKKTFSGAESGTGAEYAWVGNNKAGEGRMTMLDSKPHEQLSIKLQFLKPFPATNLTTFKLEPAPGGTTVHWIMEGENGFAGKAFALFMNMDKMLGASFEEGLANLNKAAQTSAS